MYLLSGRRGTWTALACGLGVGYLPWLHVRFGLVTLVLLGWSLFERTRGRKAVLLFAAGLALSFGSFCFYVYHVTGSLLPSGLYDTRGGFFSLSEAFLGLRILAFDTTWGLLPYSPIYALSALGVCLTWRRSPRAGALITLVLLSLAAASGHDPTAGSTTPVRYLVAGLPLLMVFLGDAAVHWQHRRVFAASFIVLALLSVEAGVTYNLHHDKGVSQLVANGFSGWRPSLLFPELTRGGWMSVPWSVALVAVWTTALLALLGVGGWRSRRGPGDQAPEPGQPAGWALHTRPGFVMAALAMIAALGSAVSATRGEWVRTDFMTTPAEARERALQAFRDQGRCTACAATAFGEANPARVVALETTAFTADVSPAPGPDLRYVVRAEARRGEHEKGWGELRVDFGDGVVERDSRVFGERLVEHTYQKAGLYLVQASFDGGAPSAFEVRRLLNVRARPDTGAAAPPFDRIEGLASEIRVCRQTARVTSVLVGSDLSVALQHDGGGGWPGSETWMVTRGGSAWRARPLAAMEHPPGVGALVGVFAVARGAAGPERTDSGDVLLARRRGGRPSRARPGRDDGGHPGSHRELTRPPLLCRVDLLPVGRALDGVDNSGPGRGLRGALYPLAQVGFHQPRRDPEEVRFAVLHEASGPPQALVRREVLVQPSSRPDQFLLAPGELRGGQPRRVPLEGADLRPLVEDDLELEDRHGEEQRKTDRQGSSHDGILPEGPREFVTRLAPRPAGAATGNLLTLALAWPPRRVSSSRDGRRARRGRRDPPSAAKARSHSMAAGVLHATLGPPGTQLAQDIPGEVPVEDRAGRGRPPWSAAGSREPVVRAGFTWSSVTSRSAQRLQASIQP